jgi:hypothetical protein
MPPEPLNSVARSVQRHLPTDLWITFLALCPVALIVSVLPSYAPNTPRLTFLHNAYQAQHQPHDVLAPLHSGVYHLDRHIRNHGLERVFGLHREHRQEQEHGLHLELPAKEVHGGCS